MWFPANQTAEKYMGGYQEDQVQGILNNLKDKTQKANSRFDFWAKSITLKILSANDDARQSKVLYLHYHKVLSAIATFLYLKNLQNENLSRCMGF